MHSLNLALIQYDLRWEDSAANKNALTSKFKEIPSPTNLVILPEMFNTGFSMNTKAIAETMQGPTLTWMKSQAAQLQAAIIGSLAIRENKTFHNRAICVQPDGIMDYYDKRHLFAFARENEFYSPGDRRVVFKVAGWRCLIQICYDLRFPVWSRNQDDYDCIIYLANWPAVRSYAWKSLLSARAIENQAFVVGVNRIGSDGNDISYIGDSLVLSPLGEPLLSLGSNDEIGSISLDFSELQNVRTKYPFQQDRDRFYLS